MNFTSFAYKIDFCACSNQNKSSPTNYPGAGTSVNIVKRIKSQNTKKRANVDDFNISTLIIMKNNVDIVIIAYETIYQLNDTT